MLPHYLQRPSVILLLRTGHPFECCSQLLFVILCSPTTWCFRCTQLLSHAVPDVKMLGWLWQNTEEHHNYCLCCNRRGFVGPLALYAQLSPALMAHWVPSYHLASLSCLWWKPSRHCWSPRAVIHIKSKVWRYGNYRRLQHMHVCLFFLLKVWA